MSLISILNINDTNVLEMIRKMELGKFGDELYEIVKKIPMQRFSTELAGESAEALKRYYGVEKILKFHQTQEYLFVNLIEELQIQTNDNKETSESNKS